MHRSVWVEAGPSDLHGEPRSWLVAGLAGQWMGAEIFYHYDPDMNQCLCVAYRYPSQSHIGHCEKCGEVRPVRSAAAVDRPARQQFGVWPRSPGTESLRCPGPIARRAQADDLSLKDARPSGFTEEECRRCGGTRRAAAPGSRHRSRPRSVREGADDRNTRPSTAPIRLRSWRATPGSYTPVGDRPGLTVRPSLSPPI